MLCYGITLNGVIWYVLPPLIMCTQDREYILQHLLYVLKYSVQTVCWVARNKPYGAKVIRKMKAKPTFRSLPNNIMTLFYPSLPFYMCAREHGSPYHKFWIIIPWWREVIDIISTRCQSLTGSAINACLVLISREILIWRWVPLLHNVCIQITAWYQHVQ